MNAIWIRENGKSEKISEMQENHLANAYAKSVTKGVNAKVRPLLAAEILTRGVETLVPQTVRDRLSVDAPEFA